MTREQIKRTPTQRLLMMLDFACYRGNLNRHQKYLVYNIKKELKERGVLEWQEKKQYVFLTI